jgi:NAD-dependent dihydropyrimidine dehydrogenase PreA subunit
MPFCMGKIVYCHCAFADVLPKEVKEEVLRGLQEAGLSFESIPDLCAMSARNDPKLKELVQGGTLKIAACYPRAVKWLFHAAGADFPEQSEQTQVLNMRELSAEEVLAGLLEGRAEDFPREPIEAEEEGEHRPGWKPWFPVIDYERCTNCLQCLSFCLFDVYGIDAENRIRVQNQEKCKTNCPACSRVCPEVAIMFPKYGAGPINGAPVSEGDVAREKMKVDISSLLGGDIYASLRQRTASVKSRFSLERSPDKALEERRKCLSKLQTMGFIPPEVLAEIDLDSLPSPEEIQRRAREVAARAEAIRNENPERGDISKS